MTSQRCTAMLAAIALALTACSAPAGPAPAPADETPAVEPPTPARTYRVVATATFGDCPAQLEGDWTRAAGAGEEQARIALGAHAVSAIITWRSADHADGFGVMHTRECSGEYSIDVSAAR